MHLSTGGVVRADRCLPTCAVQSGEDNVKEGNLPAGRGAFNFSLNELTMEAGNVWPFSQISTSFFIFSYVQASM